MSTKSTEFHNLPFLKLAGEAGKLIQQKDWLVTSIGRPNNWPKTLCTTLSIILPAPNPMLLFWGEQKICFYNSAFLNQFINEEDPTLIFGEPLNNSLILGWQFLEKHLNSIFSGEEGFASESYFNNDTKPNEKIKINWDFNFSPVYGETAQPTAVLVTCLHSPEQLDSPPSTFETTWQINAVEALEKKEAEINAIIENSMFPIAVIKVDTMEILRANDVIIKAWGKGKDVIGKKYSEVLPELEVQEIFKYFQQVAQTGNAFTALNQKVDLVIEGIAVSQYFNYSLAALRDETGAIYAILNTAADITELTEAKLKEENNVNDLRLFKFMADIAYVNNKVISKWGYTRNEISKLNVFDIDILYNKKDFDKLFEKSSNNTSIQFVTKHKNKFGEIFPVEVSSTGLMVDGEP